ncbi:MAG: DUF5615 family PIN-like protein [bacterium]|nr:DUF5615 family PIN-like protein [bacterium]
MATRIRFYLDENVEIEVAHQLRYNGVEVITARDLGLLGESDIKHLDNASQMGYVLCTYDTDYMELAHNGVVHSGIVKGRWNKHNIGDWVNALMLIYDVLSPEDMINRIEYI